MWMTKGPRDVVVMRFLTLGFAMAALVLAVVGLVLYT
jgi:hypothetical protein